MVWQLLTWPLEGLVWIAEQVEDRATQELDHKESLQKQLTTLQIKFDLGEIEEDEFMAKEEELLEAIEAQIIAEQEQDEEQT
ncbi:gas vesicle protein G [Thalassoporum mexicanum PCC 7367]|uniref:gas vesicle protein GvpG n=1 Tax=Thalassoporum mexicanum TaxID=3457544 RepID=UPI00029FFC7E|nr:gas vesicle protein GvpG [Pseudanabaena sp. PCC 7367]AFY68549.1 gas vesicle protein G [Pseudanabaena sp. PCC 7367]